MIYDICNISGVDKAESEHNVAIEGGYIDLLLIALASPHKTKPFLHQTR